MKAIGFRADPRTVFWAVVVRGADGNVLEDTGKLIAAKTSSEAEALGSPRLLIYPEPGLITRLHLGSVAERSRRRAMGRNADLVKRTPVW